MATTTKKSISIDDLYEEITRNEKESLQIAQPSGKRLNTGELREAKKENRYYLPVLSLNDTSMWPPKPNSKRRHFTDEEACRTCLTECCGYPGVFSACCRLDPEDLEHVLGPVTESWIKKILRYFAKKGLKYTRHDVIIDYEEGKYIGEHFFNNHPIFHKKDTYPILRIQVMGPRFGCKFLNPHNGKCGIYEARPDMCRNYYCSYVRANFFVKTPQHPNTYKRVDGRNNYGNRDDE